ncbi:MAG: hypothetical protein A2054_09795 [Deltaproteobacteria bacterium GWA2_55_10]|nr:MAG: hypothetical protein A2054_09795 [Deltaproteobacteria bacterium GWA2_55_10]
MIYVIGIGIQGRASLLGRPLDIIHNAGLLVGGKRHLDEFADARAERIALGGILDAARAIDRHIKKSRKPVAILATGDPLLFGIGSFILKRFGKKRVEIIPNVSAIQEAFALIKEDLNDVKILSVHGREADFSRLSDEARSNRKLAVFTDKENTPARICSELLERGVNGFKAYVCESLGADEKVIEGTLEKIAKRKSFGPLNVLILIREDDVNAAQSAPGIPDALFAHSNGMITKEEFRVISLAKLELKKGDVVWDIGACSGSVAIEAGRITGNAVFAVEKDRKRVRDIKENKKRFGSAELKIVEGNAPAALKGLPRPDAVFVGGGGNGIREILGAVGKALKPGGRVVVNAITMETASAAFEFFKKGWTRELVLASVSKARSAGELNMLSAHNPVFIIKGKR